VALPAKFPIEVDDLTAAWFSTALQCEVADATVLDRSTGTTGRARVALQGEPGLPATVFVKLPPFDASQREFVQRTGMGPTEARFYRDLAGEVDVRVPRVWFADTDEHDYVMVLEDLVASGCRFPSATDADVAERARDIVNQLARLHAPYWESPRFVPHGDLHWLAERGARGAGGGRRFIERAVDAFGDQMGDTFGRIAEIYLARTNDIVELWRQGPATLVHGDDHMGNLFVDEANDGRTGFLDWAVVCRMPAMRDVSYVLCNSVPAEVREKNERELVEMYCARLAERGVALDPDDAWEQHRLHAVYSWVAAVSTAGMGSKWQPIEIGMAGSRRATAACEHLDSAGRLESMLQ
jgi:hypothetical protein